jgi:hypothetical protein
MQDVCDRDANEYCAWQPFFLAVSVFVANWAVFLELEYVIHQTNE